jgi:hypothetical protein
LFGKKRKPRAQLDPCADFAYKLAGRKIPSQLAAEEAKRKAAEAKAHAAKARQDLPK